MQALIKTANSQHLVSPGQELLLDKPQIDGVLLLIDDDKVTVGQPLLTQVQVSFEDLGKVKGKKLRVSKFKAKSRYRKTVGFRPQYSKIKIKDIKLV